MLKITLIFVALASLIGCGDIDTDFKVVTNGVVAAQSGDNSAKTKLEKAVAMGKMTQAEVDKKLASLQGEYHKAKGKWAGKKMTGEKLQVLLDKSVAAGKMTQAEADEKLASLQGKYHKAKGKWAGKKMTGEKLQVLLDKSVAAGKMTQAEADEKLEKFQANPSGKRGMK
jgi:polyhydroxyalkanoate synthesis regulator phasin